MTLPFSGQGTLSVSLQFSPVCTLGVVQVGCFNTAAARNKSSLELQIFGLEKLEGAGKKCLQVQGILWNGGSMGQNWAVFAVVVGGVAQAYPDSLLKQIFDGRCGKFGNPVCQRD